ncbi:unnamed protein product, partial [Effrenium voratum]
INLNCNYAAKRHRDANNFGPSLIAGMGNYKGGELSVWPEDNKSSHLNQLPAKEKVTVDISENLVMFNGNTAHEVQDFEGERFSIVFFCCGCHAKTPAEVKKELTELGFPVPPADEERYRMLRQPRGYGAKSTAAKSGKLALRMFPLKKPTKSLAPTVGTSVPKRKAK